MMPTNQFRGDLDLVYPPALERFLILADRCNKRGKVYYATELHRTYARSFVLAQAYLEHKGPRAAGGGNSGHNFGLCSDWALDISPAPGLQPSWKPEDFDVLVEEAAKLGLKSGRSYGDNPHVEWPGFVSASDLAPLDLIYKKTSGTTLAKLKAVWSYVDLHSPNLPVIS